MRPSLALLGPLVFVAATGCASPPAVVDMTPRFEVGRARLESLESYAAIRTPLVDVSAHVGFTWRAEVVATGSEGAVIEACMTRVVATLPGGLGIDTDALIPLGRLTGLGALLFELLEARFQYRVSPRGEVMVSGWSKIVDIAAGAAGAAVPSDGSIPSEEALRTALEMAYRAMPRREVALGESWSRTLDYKLQGHEGPRLDGLERYTYEGWGELTVPFGGDDVDVDGLGVPLEARTEVTAAGLLYLGEIETQIGRRWGTLIVGVRGDEVLGYHEAHQLTVAPHPAAALVLAAVAPLEVGWVFFADPWR